MQVTRYIFSICLGLVFLFFLEGCMTLGSAFEFENYSVVGWIFQVVAVIAVVSGAILLTARKTEK